MQLMNCFTDKPAPVYLSIKSKKCNSNAAVRLASVIGIYGVL